MLLSPSMTLTSYGAAKSSSTTLDFNIRSSSRRRVGMHSGGHSTMQVLLRKSDTRQSVKCAICGQGFRVYWEPASPAERITVRAIIAGGLKLQHDTDRTAAAHPSRAFNLSSWGRSTEFAGTSLIGAPAKAGRAAAPGRNGADRSSSLGREQLGEREAGRKKAGLK
jgi:hypothetical protein